MINSLLSINRAAYISHGNSHIRCFSTFFGYGKSAGTAVHVTKYKITRELTDENINSSFEDFSIFQPTRDDLVTEWKEIPLFIRFLHLICEREKRLDDFRDFAKRCKDGLTVEKDVYVTVNELVDLMWSHGFSDQERNALLFTFPKDYQFHAPELAILFNIDEKDCFDFCLNLRIDSSHVGEVRGEVVKRRGLLRDHWLIYASGWFLFKSYPFFNYMFYCKAFGFGLWFVSCWHLFGKYATGAWNRQENLLGKNRESERLRGQDAILTAMKRFSKDSDCVDHIRDFGRELISNCENYHEAYASKLRGELTSTVTSQLMAIKRFDDSMASKLNQLILDQTVDSLKCTDEFDIASIQHSLSTLNQSSNKGLRDPVVDHFRNSFRNIQTADWAKVRADRHGSLVEKIQFVLKQSESQFSDQFMVSAHERDRILHITNAAKEGSGKYNWDKLEEGIMTELESLFTRINQKVGIVVAHEKDLEVVYGREKINQYSEHVNGLLNELRRKIRNDRLTSFAQGF